MDTVIITLIIYLLGAWILVKPLHSYIATPREKWTAMGLSEKIKDRFAKIDKEIDKETAITLSIIWPLTIPFLITREVYAKIRNLLGNRIK